MLSLEQVSYHPATTPRPLLRQVSMAASLGETAVVTGASGAGKSTLLELVAGLIRPSQGRICWQGKPMGQRQRHRRCGLVFQFPERHFLGLTTRQELQLGQRRLTEERLGAVLTQVGLHHVSPKQPPERLSGGQQRRLALAVQLLRDPQVLLLDEPTAGLDWSVRESLLELLRQLRTGRVLVVATHEPKLFTPLKPRCWRLQDGELEPC
ncbi:MAG: lytic murein transglycosylase [Candidatus Synechococcus spongiarum 15L]|uniref:Lytic murein transglycosylase n=1 Tax=Candidatus Synechococcus spongiarum 15L TaxID=1608419 RepID=A0A0G8AZ11_9SYNE|nr:MAG: lytic murein transglycosylase [Candidatus Synechococcus spongiarum 15L]MCY4360164.1 ABC transporter ATP-binding protein [Cyanobacteria bacterium MAG APA_bin_95]